MGVIFWAPSLQFWAAVLQFTSSVVPPRTGSLCLPRRCPFAWVLPHVGCLEPALGTCPTLQSRLGKQDQKGSTERLCRRQLALPWRADTPALLWSGLPAGAAFLLPFEVDCSLVAVLAQAVNLDEMQTSGRSVERRPLSFLRLLWLATALHAGEEGAMR